MKYINKILNLIYPNVCGFCGKICDTNICKKCELNIKNKILCKTIYYANSDIYYNKHFYIFKYEGIIREKLLEYKFYNKSYMYKCFGEIMIKNKKTFGFLKNYDIIIPVPIHKKRKLERGYNQTELICRFLAKNIDTLQILNVLKKIQNTHPQSTLNKSERKNNVNGIYEIKNFYQLNNKKVLLLDDIYTTGSTVNECCKILRTSNPKQLDVITIAKD